MADVHLDPSEPATAEAWQQYLATTDCDALCILGDLFEVWIGDDLLAPEHRASHAFVQTCCTALRDFAQRRPLYVMHGNRDFLLGPDFYRHCQATPLPDPTLLQWQQQHWLLSHGDAWCVDDQAYMQFRAQVRTTDWQDAFLRRPLPEREAIGRQLRAASEARKRSELPHGGTMAHYTDLDPDTVMHWLTTTGAKGLIHGHTHQPADHRLPNGQWRLVLSDWDAHPTPPRLQTLRLQADGTWQRPSLR